MVTSSNFLCLLTLLSFCPSFGTPEQLRRASGDKKETTLNENVHRELEWYRKSDPKSIENKTNGGLKKAFYDSYGFFYDIPADDWNRYRSISIERQENQHRPGIRTKGVDPRKFYQQNWEPEFSCQFEKRIGIMGDGGKWVCDPHRIQILSNIRKTPDGRDDPCLVYSIGSNGMHQFEHGLMDEIGEDECEIHTFEVRSFDEMIIRDKTDEDRRKTKKIHMHYNWGLRGSEEAPQKGLYTLAETIKALGHEGRTIDILKIDCDGCEWTSYIDWIDPPAMPVQILAEIHNNPKGSNKLFKEMRKGGYVIFHKEPNIQFGGGKCVEFGFLKMRPGFNLESER